MSPAQSTGDAEAFWPMGQWTDASADESVTELLSRELSLSPATARILAARGFTEPTETKEFLEPRLSRCMYPDWLPGIAQAATIIGTHVGFGHRIVVFGDFDADGMTASTILRSALVAIGAQADIFIPDRIKEGCGVTEAALDRCFAEHPGIKLIVTVDCSISRASVCDKAAAAGVEVVVTDHHEMERSVSKGALALVNPCFPDTPEPMKHLCGAGVAFKLAHELVRRYMTKEAGQAFMQSLVAIAAVGTVGDLVPLVGENRIIASCGLAILNRAPASELVGLRALRESANLRGPIDAGTLAFLLVPRINAAGRVGNPQVVIDLLAARDMATALPLARRLGDFNQLRREEEQAAVQSAEAGIRSCMESNPSALILFNATWHPGVIGLVASRISNRNHRPTIVFTSDDEEGVVRGSARCPEIPGLDLTKLLNRCKDLLLTHGGHRAAAGLTLRLENLETFKQRFLSVCAEAENGLDMRTERRIEVWIEPQDATDCLESELVRIGPFGTLNPQPLLGMRGVTLASDPSKFGRVSTNWRLDLEETPVPAILFGHSEMPFRKGDKLDMVFHFSRDNYEALQFFVKDLRRAQA